MNEQGKEVTVDQSKLVERIGIHRQQDHLILQILHVTVETPPIFIFLGLYQIDPWFASLITLSSALAQGN